jgi:hypothetical protein
MKMGNTSLSIIPVPNFYMNRTLYQMETFRIKKKKNYFKECELFKKTKDLNLSNNPRLNLNKFEDFNKTKYIPPLRSRSLAKVDLKSRTGLMNTIGDGDYQAQAQNTSQNNQNSSQNLDKIPIEITEYAKYEEYMKKHQSNFENPEFGVTLRNNINTIIDRINSNYELDKWTTSKETTPEYLTQINSRITHDEFHENENESCKFQETLKKKINSLQLDRKNKEKVLKTFIKNTESNDKLTRTSTTNTEKFYNTTSHGNLNIPYLLPNSISNTHISTVDNKASNTSNKFYNTSFGSSNKLSDTKNEFSQMKAEKVSFRRKDGLLKDEIDPRIYNAYNHRGVYEKKNESELKAYLK